MHPWHVWSLISGVLTCFHGKKLILPNFSSLRGVATLDCEYHGQAGSTMRSWGVALVMQYWIANWMIWSLRYQWTSFMGRSRRRSQLPPARFWSWKSSVHYSLFIIHDSLLTIYCWLFIIYCSFFTLHYHAPTRQLVEEKGDVAARW